jgi:hypothetical protein
MMAAWVAIRRNAHVTRALGDNWLRQGGAHAPRPFSPGLPYLLTIAGLRGESLQMQLTHDRLLSALSRSKLTSKYVLASEASTRQADAA